MSTQSSNNQRSHSAQTLYVSFALLSLLIAAAGCGAGKKASVQNQSFFTSGSREADQRASQRMAKSEQISGEGAGEKNVKKAERAPDSKEGGGPRPAQAEDKLPLFDRLGGEAGLAAIVDDFLPRATQDPRVNWDRTDVKRNGLLHKGQSSGWNPSPENVATLKKHLIQFLDLATGGPSHYDGKQMKAAHAGMQISNPEFDAAIGDLKASLDKLRIPDKEQKELLSIIESTRPEIVTKR